MCVSSECKPRGLPLLRCEFVVSGWVSGWAGVRESVFECVSVWLGVSEWVQVCLVGCE